MINTENLLQGSQVLPLTTDESRVPILLVHQPGSKDHKGFGEGWDLIVPAGWGENSVLLHSRKVDYFEEVFFI